MNVETTPFTKADGSLAFETKLRSRTDDTIEEIASMLRAFFGAAGEFNKRGSL